MALHTLGGSASEKPLHVTPFTGHLSMPSTQREPRRSVVDFDIRAIASLSLTFARQHQSIHEQQHAENRRVRQELCDPPPRLLFQRTLHAALTLPFIACSSRPPDHGNVRAELIPTNQDARLAHDVKWEICPKRHANDVPSRLPTTKSLISQNKTDIGLDIHWKMPHMLRTECICRPTVLRVG